MDSSDRDWIFQTAQMLAPSIEWLKIGLESYTAFGGGLVSDLRETDCRVFLDLKLHDIPNTVQMAARNCARTGAHMINVHATGGRAMMQAAVSGVHSAAGDEPTKVIAVTVLTSLDNDGLASLGFAKSADDLVIDLARLAQDCGLDGVVASAREAAAIRSACGSEFIIVTPGIRPTWAATADQKRVVTPGDAVESGADVLVVGRPITGSNDPVESAARIRQEMESAPKPS